MAIEPEPDEVWEDADGMWVCCTLDPFVDSKRGWMAFGTARLVDPILSYPLRKIRDSDGCLVSEEVLYDPRIVDAVAEPEPKTTLMKRLENVAAGNRGLISAPIAHVVMAEHLHAMYDFELRDLFDAVYNHEIVDHGELRTRLRTILMGSPRMHLDTLERERREREGITGGEPF